MGKMRTRAIRRKLAALLAAGMVFQSVQCTTAGNQQLLSELVQNVGAVFITNYVNDLFGVAASPF